jgi:hypothetical protein
MRDKLYFLESFPFVRSNCLMHFRKQQKVGLLCIILIIAACFCGCKDNGAATHSKKVFIRSENGKYILYRDGKPFQIKGASGFTNLKTLKEAGGNTIRTWDTTNISSILNEAEANHLGVVVGLPMPDNGEMDIFYNRPEQVKKQFDDYSALVNKYKDHPAVLFWCVGNELPFPYKLSYSNFYKSFNSIVDMIHMKDPNHPVTTTVLNVQEKNIINIKLRTNIDFLSFNIFGAIRTLKQDLKDLEWIWKGPFLITEWGIDGPWNSYQQTAWAAYIENTSTKNAELLLKRYRQFMPVDDPRFLGSLIFYWGEKQETTKTWFSLFDEHGAASEAVDVMQYIWTSKWPERYAPKIKYMLLEDKGARDNIILNPSETVSAKLFLDQADTLGLSYTWEIQPEDWYKISGANNTKKIRPIENLMISQGHSKTTLRTPAKEGPYRLFVFVKDKFGRFSSCNTPFYVVER